MRRADVLFAKSQSFLSEGDRLSILVLLAQHTCTTQIKLQILAVIVKCLHAYEPAFGFNQSAKSGQS